MEVIDPGEGSAVVIVGLAGIDGLGGFVRARPIHPCGKGTDHNDRLAGYGRSAHPARSPSNKLSRASSTVIMQFLLIENFGACGTKRVSS
jgi:hypothetical protein